MTIDMLNEQIVMSSPLRRWIKPSEIGKLAGLLVSDAAALLTGQFLIAGKAKCVVRYVALSLIRMTSTDHANVLQMVVLSSARLNMLPQMRLRHQTWSTNLAADHTELETGS